MTAPLTFRRFAGSLQLDLPNFEALEAAIQVPESLWIAMACPVEGLSCSKRLLELMDQDGNRRIRVQELKAAVKFVADHLADRRGCSEASDVLELSSLSELGRLLRPAAELLLDRLAAEDRSRLTLPQLELGLAHLKAKALLGEGILVADSLEDPALRDAVTSIMAALPPVLNSHGQAGITLSSVQAWRSHQEALKSHLATRDEVFVWGAESLARAQAVERVKERMEEYFLQCRLVASQPDTADYLRLTGETVTDLMGDTPALSRAVAALPIAPPRSDGTLVLSLLNRGPYLEALQALAHEVLQPCLGHSDILLEAEWHLLLAQAERILAWEAVRAANPLLKAGVDAALPEEALESLEALIQFDLDCKPRLDLVAALERLMVYQRHLLEFANNFISMPGLYHAEKPASFQLGTLYMAGREFLLAVMVPNHAEHLKLVSSNTLCLAYVKILSHLPTEPDFEVAVPITSGSSSSIVPGRRGVFLRYDQKEFDSVVLEVVRNPVSLSEAMLLPFSRVGQFISGKLEVFSNSGLSTLDTQLAKGYQTASSTATGAVAAAQQASSGVPAAPAAAPAPPPAAAQPPVSAATSLAGGGVALAALGSSLAFALSQLRQVSLMEVASTVLMLFAIVAVPSGLLGYLKLRRRNLAVVLEGSGWALNDRLLVNTQLGELLTRRPKVPSHARLLRLDEVTERLRLRRLTGYEGAEDDVLRWWHVALIFLALATYVLIQLQPLLKFKLPF